MCGLASPVLLVLACGTVSQAAIYRTAELAAGAPVIVIGVSGGPGVHGASPRAGGASGGSAASGAEPEHVRRAVALAMSALDDSGVAALGHLAVTGAPGRTVARVARARGAHIVVLDQASAAGRASVADGRGGVAAGSRGGPGADGLAAELRRRMYGSGITVVTASDRVTQGRGLCPLRLPTGT